MKKHRYENGNPPQSINDWRYHIVKDGMPMNVHQCLEELNRLQEHLAMRERSIEMLGGQVDSLLYGNTLLTSPLPGGNW